MRSNLFVPFLSLLLLDAATPPGRKSVPKTGVTGVFLLDSFLDNTYSALNSATKMAKKSSTLITNSFYAPNDDLAKLEELETKVLLPVVPVSKDSSSEECPMKFREPSALPSFVVREVAGGVERLAKAPLQLEQLEEIVPGYVYGKKISAFKEYELTAILIRAPVKYERAYSPKLQHWFHGLVNDILDPVIRYIGVHPRQQFILSGVGDGGSVALLCAWLIYAQNPWLQTCGKGSNKLNQLVVMMFGGSETVTGSALIGFKLRHRNVLNFRQHPAPPFHDAFQVIGISYDIQDSLTTIAPPKVTQEEAHKLISQEPDWRVALSKKQNPVVLQKAVVKLKELSSQAAYFANTAEEAFNLEAEKHLHRNSYWCAEQIHETLMRALEMSTIPTIDCRVTQMSYENKSAVVTCYINTVYNHIDQVQAFVEYDIAVHKSAEKAKAHLKKITVSGNVSNQWSTCMETIFKDSPSLKRLNPFQKSEEQSYEYTKVHSQNKGQCAVRVRSGPDLLFTLYKHTTQAFFELFSASGRFKQALPQECIGIVQPMVISEAKKGNGNEWFRCVKSFIGDLEKIVGTDTHTLTDTPGFHVEDSWTSHPDSHSVAPFPQNILPLLPILSACVSEQTLVNMYDCRIPENQRTGNEICPKLCEKMRNAPNTCSRVVHCGQGVSLGFRGGGMFGISSARQSFTNRTRVNPDIGEFLSLSLTDKSVRFAALRIPFYVTIFVDPSSNMKFKRLALRAEDPNLSSTSNSPSSSTTRNVSDPQQFTRTTDSTTNIYNDYSEYDFNENNGYKDEEEDEEEDDDFVQVNYSDLDNFMENLVAGQVTNKSSPSSTTSTCTTVTGSTVDSQASLVEKAIKVKEDPSKASTDKFLALKEKKKPAVDDRKSSKPVEKMEEQEGQKKIADSKIKATVVQDREIDKNLMLTVMTDVAIEKSEAPKVPISTKIPAVLETLAEDTEAELPKSETQIAGEQPEEEVQKSEERKTRTEKVLEKYSKEEKVVKKVNSEKHGKKLHGNNFYETHQ